ncbi:hypothetical protein Y1Q_0007397 [Alligator mississippiensis]|uniref:Uncharacterized protein n=1 Tax=Alligator mississippiensis TaxID=8496 RepID=A0A151P7U8_ALLMI|nr:hypothetical protein Y1Q_0007397 [Alligator mississippiensis]
MMKQRRWRVRKKPMQPIHHLLLPRPKNMLDLLASAVAAMDLFSNHCDTWPPGTAPQSHYSRALQRFSQQAVMALRNLA